MCEPWWSGGAMARTGLRMMPTFPSPSLKFRTASFPQYGFKASLSGRAFLHRRAVKPAPGIPTSPSSLHRPFARFRHGIAAPGTESRPIRASACRCTRGTHLATPGVLGSGPSYVVSVHHRVLRPHPSVSQARDDFTACRLYAAPSLCGSAEATRETFPTFPVVLSARAVDPTPVGPRHLPVVVVSRYQASSFL